MCLTTHPSCYEDQCLRYGMSSLPFALWSQPCIPAGRYCTPRYQQLWSCRSSQKSVIFQTSITADATGTKSSSSQPLLSMQSIEGLGSFSAQDRQMIQLIFQSLLVLQFRPTSWALHLENVQDCTNEIVAIQTGLMRPGQSCSESATL